MQTDEQALDWFRNIVSNLYQRMLDRGVKPEDINKVMEGVSEANYSNLRLQEIIHEHSDST